VLGNAAKATAIAVASAGIAVLAGSTAPVTLAADMTSALSTAGAMASTVTGQVLAVAAAQAANVAALAVPLFAGGLF
jgi:hypothetical protein